MFSIALKLNKHCPLPVFLDVQFGFSKQSLFVQQCTVSLHMPVTNGTEKTISHFIYEIPVIVTIREYLNSQGRGFSFQIELYHRFIPTLKHLTVQHKTTV